MGEWITGSLDHVYNTGTISWTKSGTNACALGEKKPSSPSMTEAYYDNQTSGQGDSVGTGHTTTQLQDPATFSGWSTPWVLTIGDYPHSLVFQEPLDDTFLQHRWSL